MTEKVMLGDFIYKRRKELGYSQAELGELTGVSNKAVSKWETGESNPDILLIIPLSKALKCTADELLSCQMSEVKADPQSANTINPDMQGNGAEFCNGGSCNANTSCDNSGYSTAKVFGLNGKEKRTCYEYEFISDKQNSKRDPFLHIHFGRRFSNLNAKAKGTIAIGNIASGKLAIGLIARGFLSLGLVSVGLISIGAIAIGLFLALGSFAFGLGLSMGAVAVGTLALGAISIGIYSYGAIAIGVYAHTSGTGIAIGLHPLYPSIKNFVKNVK